LQVDTSDLFGKAQAIGNHAEDLRDELALLVAGWGDLSHTWEGSAAAAYGPIFERWHENAAKVVENLAVSSRNLMTAAVAYDEQDTRGADAVGSAGGGTF
jgi:WXG100 family type VII secretion target